MNGRPLVWTAGVLPQKRPCAGEVQLLAQETQIERAASSQALYLLPVPCNTS